MRTLIQTEKAQLKLKKNLYLTTDNYSAHQVKQPYTQRGFTLIELMIVVAIIGILASIAIPAYSDYIKRARVSEMLAKAAEVKTTLSEYYASRNLFPTVAQYSIQVAAPASNIANINNQTTNGTVGVGAVGTFDVVSNAANIGALTLTFTGTATANGIGWVCTAAGADVRLAPGNCK